MDGENFSIYVHIPFCVKKCLYCDFNSGVYPDYVIASYIDALLKEIDSYKPFLFQRRLASVYIGGGTPSSVPPSYIGLIIERISDVTSIDEDTEISMEINPGTASDHKIKDYVSFGVNRMSIGLQSAVNSELEALGRIHTFENFRSTFDAIRSNGIENINVDIMTSIPHQTKGTLFKTLQEVAGLRPAHISAYSLIIEKGTPFYEMGPVRLDLPSENDSYEMEKELQRYLRDHGYERYEISNYARKETGRDNRCRHNLRYWDRDDYIGIGVSAASLIENRRFTNIADIGRYITSPGRYKSEDLILSEADAMAEFMFLGLRKTEGIKTSDFEKTFGIDIEKVYGKVMKEHIEGEFAETEGEDEERRFFLTDKGLDISNRVMADYLLQV